MHKVRTAAAISLSLILACSALLLGACETYTTERVESVPLPLAPKQEPTFEELTAADPAYEEARAQRYTAYAAAHPQHNVDEVVWQVDVNLDMAPYEDTERSSGDNTITILVNKHFGVGEDYVPEGLTELPDRPGVSMVSEAADAITAMQAAAEAAGVPFIVQNAYRPYSQQKAIYEDYVAKDSKENADTYSARPGFSEHQTGLTADINVRVQGVSMFADTPQAEWVAEHARDYGFIVRYTDENEAVTQYVPEPWHIRYIGKENAARMYEEGIASFEEYWVKYVQHG